MSDGGFAIQPEQESKEESTFETKPAQAPEPTAEQGGLDEVAIKELRALKEMAEAQEEAQKDTFLEEGEEGASGVYANTITGTEPVKSERMQDDILIEVEKILEEDLGELVSNMNAKDREKFEKKGLEVSGQIAQMVRTFKLKMEKVVILIREWLQAIPGVNKYFLEQEAKIKSDKIMHLEQERKEEAQNNIAT